MVNWIVWNRTVLTFNCMWTKTILILNWIVWIRTVWLNWIAWNRTVHSRQMPFMRQLYVDTFTPSHLLTLAITLHSAEEAKCMKKKKKKKKQQRLIFKSVALKTTSTNGKEVKVLFQEIKHFINSATFDPCEKTFVPAAVIGYGSRQNDCHYQGLEKKYPKINSGYNYNLFWDTNKVIIKAKVKLTTLVKCDLKAPFSIATTLRCRGGRHFIPWIAPLYPWSVPYNPEC